LAEMLAECLGAELVSREILVEAATAYGFEEKLLADVMDRAPRFWERLTPRRKTYLRFISAALLTRAETGNLVYHGNAGHLLLRDVPCVLRVKLIAPLEQRIKLVMDNQGISRNEALIYLKAVDETRIKWTRFLYGVDWNDPALFDVVINLEKMSLETACDMICLAAERDPCRTDASSLILLRNRALEARILATLAADNRTQTLDIEVQADGGTVRLSGVIEVEKVRRTLLEIHDELTVSKLSPIPT